MTTIYALFDSRYGAAPRYVGKTTQALCDRLRSHVLFAKRGGCSHRYNWVRAVMSAGAHIFIEALAVTWGNDAANELERRYIAELRSAGADLVNTTEGGDGLTKGWKHSGEALERLRAGGIKRRGMKRSPETIALVKAAHIGRKRSAETRARISVAKIGKPNLKRRGVALPEWHKQAVRASWTQERRDAQAERNKRMVWTPEIRAKQSEAQRRRYARGGA